MEKAKSSNQAGMTQILRTLIFSPNQLINFVVTLVLVLGVHHTGLGPVHSTILTVVLLTLSLTVAVRLGLEKIQEQNETLKKKIERQNEILLEQSQSADAAQRETMELASFLANILSAMTSSVIILDLDYTIKSVNQVFEEILGVGAEELVGQRLTDILHSSDILSLAGVDPLFDNRTKFNGINMTFSSASDDSVTLKTSGAVVTDDTDNAVGYVLCANDERELMRLLSIEAKAAVAQRDRAEELSLLHEALQETTQRELNHSKNLLVQSEKLSQLGAMVASIGHEVATPILLVSMSTENTLETIDILEKKLTPLFTGNPKAEQFGRVIGKLIASLRESNQSSTAGAKRLSELSLALRTQSRMEINITLSVDIMKVVNESLTLVAGRTKFYDVQVESRETPAISCYRSKIGQVLTNLLANAADALNEKSERIKTQGQPRFPGVICVTVSPLTRDGQDGVAVIVSDNGDGVPKVIQDKIFEQFFTTKPAGVGTGLGLSMCANIVLEHGGHLSVGEDDKLGGARFELWLPCQPPPQGQGRSAKAEEQTERPAIEGH